MQGMEDELVAQVREAIRKWHRITELRRQMEELDKEYSVVAYVLILAIYERSRFLHNVLYSRFGILFLPSKDRFCVLVPKRAPKEIQELVSSPNGEAGEETLSPEIPPRAVRERVLEFIQTRNAVLMFEFLAHRMEEAEQEAERNGEDPGRAMWTAHWEAHDLFWSFYFGAHAHLHLAREAAIDSAAIEFGRRANQFVGE